MHAVRARSAFDGERFLHGGVTVILDGPVIVGVEPGSGDLSPDVPLRTYDGTVLPGLVDAHVHLVSDASMGSLEAAGAADPAAIDDVIGASLRQQVAGGVTTVRDLGDVGYHTLRHRDDATDGLPRILAAGPPLTTPEGHCHFLGGVVGDGGFAAAVGERVDRGVDVVKVMASGGMLTPGSDQLGAQFEVTELRALVELAHAAGLRVLAHAHSTIALERSVEAGVDGIEHVTCLTSQGPVLPEGILDRVAAAGITLDPTLGFDPARVPPIEQAPPAIRALAERLGLTMAVLAEFRARQMVLAHEHGVRVVSGLDAGAAPTKRHGELWRAVTALVAGGFPLDAALASATSVAADDCGVDTGRLRVGASADLLVVDGDLAADPAALSRPVAVIARGRPAVTD